ncbi:Uncharacterized protein PCOAH_00001090 [Plasmodium coatneyi]|uniref:Uncharacterized protein n=1 Tax=Plasmodium coatneyi TaxID=208452 RepID=A0A1B1DST3_9APIC|nr:Uncharacterized protein PCOAH_00001090 [Plasmodium coatneyi]ANQ05802.1 Uncharacterized protein PCOAH_00001090 [Plasmodium coatneyi]
MHTSDVPQEGEESANDAVAEEVTKNGGNQDLTAGGSDAGWGNSDGCHVEKHAEEATEEPTREAKKVRKSLDKAGKAAKGKLQKKKKAEAKGKVKKKDKKVAAKKARAMKKGKKDDSTGTDDTLLTDSEDELYNDDNLFMPKALKKKAHKKDKQKSKTKDKKRTLESNQISKKKHEKNEESQKKKKKNKKNKMKSKFCTAECLPLDHYEQALEKELASYAASGFKKYLKFLKNYKTTVGVEEKVVTKKPRHMGMEGGENDLREYVTVPTIKKASPAD